MTFNIYFLEPIVDRVASIDLNIPIYFLHGEKSWIIIDPSIDAQSKRQNVYLDTLKDAGNHVITQVISIEDQEFAFVFLGLC